MAATAACRGNRGKTEHPRPAFHIAKARTLSGSIVLSPKERAGQEGS